MDKSWLIFSAEEGNFLIRLLLAHFLSDFVFQTKSMVENKKWFTKEMGLHIAILFFTTAILIWSWKIAIIVTVIHWLIDALKKQFEDKINRKTLTFVIDQFLHIVSLVIIWAFNFHLFAKTLHAITLPFTEYEISFVLLSYVVVIWPVGYFIGFLLDKYNKEKSSDNAGRLIGQFERIIILTLVLLQQYEAIGFLITGKSIIRFTGSKVKTDSEKSQSEYVLLGTMLSYALAIVLGVVVRIMLNLSVL